MALSSAHFKKSGGGGGMGWLVQPTISPIAVMTALHISRGMSGVRNVFGQFSEGVAHSTAVKWE
jgi:hypothetical protein